MIQVFMEQSKFMVVVFMLILRVVNQVVFIQMMETQAITIQMDKITIRIKEIAIQEEDIIVEETNTTHITKAIRLNQESPTSVATIGATNKDDTLGQS